MGKSIPTPESDGGGEKGYGDRTLTLSKTGSGHFHVTVYQWNHSYGGYWEYYDDFNSEGGDHDIYKYHKVKVEAIGDDDEFKSWSSTPSGASTNGNVTTFEMNGHSKSASAVFGPAVQTHTVTFYDEDGTTELGTVTVNHGENADPIDDPVKEGYEFAGWSPAGNLQNVTDDVSVNATYNAKPILEFHYVEGIAGYTCSAGAVETPTAVNHVTTIYADINSDVTVSASATSGYSYNGLLTTGGYSASPVNNAASGTTYKFKAIITDATHTLTFSGSYCYYTIEGDSSEHHYVKGEKIENIVHGTEFTVTAHATGLYEFANDWDHKPSGATGTNPITFTMNDDEYVDAKMREVEFENTWFYWSNGLSKYTYSYTINGTTSSDDVVPSSYPLQVALPIGYDVTVTAVAADGYDFAGWYSTYYSYYHNSTTSTQVIKPSYSDHTNSVRAIFDESKATLKFYPSEGLAEYTYSYDGDTYTVSPTPTSSPVTVKVPAGKNVTVGATALPTHSFNDVWEYNGNTVTPTVADQTYDFKAVFDREKYSLDLDMGTGVQSYKVEYDDTTNYYHDDIVYIPMDKDVTLTAIPENNFGFDHWSATVSPSTADMHGNVWKFKMLDDYTDVTAHFGKMWEEKFTVIYDDVSFSGTGKVKVYYPDENTLVATLSQGEESDDIKYEWGKNTVIVVAVPDAPYSEFVQWTLHGNITTPKMSIDLPTGQGTEDTSAGSSKCHVTFNVHVLPEFKEKLGSLTVNKYIKDTSTLLTGAKFELRNGNGELMDETGNGENDGTFYWGLLPHGTYLLTETDAPDNYLLPSPHSWTVKIGPVEGAPCVWAVTKDIENTPEHCSLEVKKVDSSGNTITSAEATFELIRTDVDPHESYGIKETVNGVVSWSALPAGTYDLVEKFAPTNYYYTTQTHGITLSTEDDNWPNFETDITNYKCGSITVYKRDSVTEKPIDGATFTLVNDSDPLTRIQGTDNGNGKFQWTQLKPGNYTLIEDDAPTGYYDAEYSEGIELSQGEDKEIDVYNDPYGSITVYKRDSVTEELIDDATFTLVNDLDPLTPIQGTDNGNGTFTWTDLEAGDYTLTETGVPYGYYDASHSEGISLSIGEDKEITVSNEKFVSIQVIKKDHRNGNPLAGAEFSIEEAQSGGVVLGTVITDSTGKAVFAYPDFELRAGVQYLIKEVNAPYGYLNDSDDVYITIPTPGGMNEVEAEFRNNPDLGTITVAKFQSGTNRTTRISGVVFRLYRGSVAPENQVGTDQETDSAGNASWSGLFAGTYILKEISVPYGYTLPADTETTVYLAPGSTLEKAREVVIIENEGPTPTPTPPTNPPESTPTPTPSPTPTPVPTATPTPVNTEEITIEDVDPAFGPETGEGSGLFMTIGILLLMASALFIIRKKAVIRNK